MTRLGTALTCLALVAGCGNDPQNQNTGLDLIQELVANLSSEPPAPPSPQIISQALAETEGPLELFQREDNQRWGLMLKLEENRGYETFGTAFRQTATMRNGLLTATRGFGGDLMSVDISEVAPLISGRKPGQGTRIVRFLGDEDKTTELRFECSVTVGQSVAVTSGALDVMARQVTETCQGDGREITNNYLVDSNGRSVSAKQWVTPLNGYFLTQTLRQ